MEKLLRRNRESKVDGDDIRFGRDRVLVQLCRDKIDYINDLSSRLERKRNYFDSMRKGDVEEIFKENRKIKISTFLSNSRLKFRFEESDQRLCELHKTLVW